MDCGPDWLSFTVPYDQGKAVAGLLPGGLTPLEVGFRGYTHSALVAGGKGRVAWSPERQEMGYHVDLSAGAMEVLTGLGLTDWPAFVRAVREVYHGHLTRFDWCWDDKEGLLDLDKIEAAVKGRVYTSRWEGVDIRTSQAQPGASWGRTFYFGSRESDSLLRIYDKAVEEGQAGPWVRVEIQFRRVRADAAGAVFAEHGCDRVRVSEKFAGILRGYIEFKAGPEPVQKTRWRMVSWWGRFLGYAGKARLVVASKGLGTVEEVKAWFADQVGPSLALIVASMGDFGEGWGWVYQQAELGRFRWSVRHRAILGASAAT